MTNWTGGVLYIGVTSNLERRVWEHKNNALKGFTSKYNLNKLVYIEETSDASAAIAREKQLKSWRREKKDALVATMNPEWKALSLTEPVKIPRFARDDK